VEFIGVESQHSNNSSRINSFEETAWGQISTINNWFALLKVLNRARNELLRSDFRTNYYDLPLMAAGASDAPVTRAASA